MGGSLAVGEDDKVVLRASKSQDALVHGVAAFRDRPSDAAATNERKRFHRLAVAQRLGRLPATVHDLEHPWRNALHSGGDNRARRGGGGRGGRVARAWLVDFRGDFVCVQHGVSHRDPIY